MKMLTEIDLTDLAIGACLFGSGGGGPLSIATQLIQDILRASQPPRLIDPREVGDQERLGISAYEGSPDAAAAGAFQFDAATIAFKALNAQEDNRLRYLMAIEVGAGNSLIPFTVGGRLGLPVIDADGAGRAIPALTMCTFSAHQLPISPVVLANDALQISLRVKDAATCETASRALLSQAGFGQDAGLALWAMDGYAMKRTAIRGSVSQAIALGAALRVALQAHVDPVQTVAKQVGGRVFFTGTIQHFIQTTNGGFDLGQMTLVNTEGQQRVVISQNENLLLWDVQQPAPLLTAPDLIMMMTTDGQVFSNADVHSVSGKQIAVIGAPSASVLHEPPLLGVFQAALRALGYAGANVPFV